MYPDASGYIVSNGPWGSDWFALGGSPFQFVQGVPKKSVILGVKKTTSLLAKAPKSALFSETPYRAL